MAGELGGETVIDRSALETMGKQAKIIDFSNIGELVDDVSSTELEKAKLSRETDKGDIRKYNDDANDSDGVFARFSSRVEDYYHQLKLDNINEDNVVFKNQSWQKPDEKTLKQVSKNIKDAQEVIKIFDKTHEKFKKWGFRLFLLCLLCPFVIPAVAGVLFVVGTGYAVHEVMAQKTYNKAIKPLTNNGQNPYRRMTYSKGFKEIEKLTQKQYSNDDLKKLWIEQAEKEKDPKVKEAILNNIAALDAQNQALENVVKQNANEIKAENSKDATNVEQVNPAKDSAVIERDVAFDGENPNPESKQEVLEPEQIVGDDAKKGDEQNQTLKDDKKAEELSKTDETAKLEDADEQDENINPKQNEKKLEEHEQGR